MARENVHKGAGGEGSVYQRPDRGLAWWMAWMIPGEGGKRETRRPAVMANGKPAETAKQALHCLKIEQDKVTLHETGHKQYVSKDAGKITVNELCDAVIASYKSEKRVSVPAATAHLDHIRKALGARFALGIRRKDLDDFVAGQREAPNPKNPKKPGYSESSIRQRLMYLSRGYTLMEADLHFKPEFPEIDCSENVREGFLEPDEFRGFLKEFGDEADLQDFIEWGFWTGWRRGAISGLEWTALNRSGAIWLLTLPHRLAKNDAAQTVPLKPGNPLRLILERRVAARVVGCKYIFHRRGNKAYAFYEVWRSAVKRAVEKGALAPEKAGLLFHDLRRSAVSNMINLGGMDKKLAKMISGHLTDSMIDRYHIVKTGHLGDAIDGFTGKVGSVR